MSALTSGHVVSSVRTQTAATTAPVLMAMTSRTLASAKPTVVGHKITNLRCFDVKRVNI